MHGHGGPTTNLFLVEEGANIRLIVDDDISIRPAASEKQQQDAPGRTISHLASSSSSTQLEVSNAHYEIDAKKNQSNEHRFALRNSSPMPW
jgi:hypothetical protein